MSSVASSLQFVCMRINYITVQFRPDKMNMSWVNIPVPCSRSVVSACTCWSLISTASVCTFWSFTSTLSEPAAVKTEFHSNPSRHLQIHQYLLIKNEIMYNSKHSSNHIQSFRNNLMVLISFWKKNDNNVVSWSLIEITFSFCVYKRF